MRCAFFIFFLILCQILQNPIILRNFFHIAWQVFFSFLKSIFKIETMFYFVLRGPTSHLEPSHPIALARPHFPKTVHCFQPTIELTWPLMSNFHLQYNFLSLDRLAWSSRWLLWRPLQKDSCCAALDSLAVPVGRVSTMPLPTLFVSFDILRFLWVRSQTKI